MAKNLIVATSNKGKLNEIREVLSEMNLNIISMRDAGYFDEIEENGRTFEENALIKVRAVHKLTGGYVIGDDSGLEVDYLNGMPGVFSSRFAGENATDEDRNRKLVRLLDGVPDEMRTARFVCVIAVMLPDENTIIAKGVCEGKIGFSMVGEKGFGYDPLFIVGNLKKTMAQLDMKEKNSLSHRGKALEEIRRKLTLKFNELEE